MSRIYKFSFKIESPTSEESYIHLIEYEKLTIREYCYLLYISDMITPVIMHLKIDEDDGYHKYDYSIVIYPIIKYHDCYYDYHSIKKLYNDAAYNLYYNKKKSIGKRIDIENRFYNYSNGYFENPYYVRKEDIFYVFDFLRKTINKIEHNNHELYIYKYREDIYGSIKYIEQFSDIIIEFSF